MTVLSCLQTHSLAKEIQDHKTAIEKLQAERNKLQGVIRTLEKDIVGLKKEMQERDETIMDKVRLCMYHMPRP